MELWSLCCTKLSNHWFSCIGLYCMLEYASPVWNPHLIKDIKRLESVQSSAFAISTATAERNARSVSKDDFPPVSPPLNATTRVIFVQSLFGYKLGTYKSHTSPYHPISDGQSERIQSLRKGDEHPALTQKSYRNLTLLLNIELPCSENHVDCTSGWPVATLRFG